MSSIEAKSNHAVEASHNHSASCSCTEHNTNNSEHNHGSCSIDDECGCGHNHEEGGEIIKTPLFIIGIILFIMGFAAEHFDVIYTSLGIAPSISKWISFGLLLVAYILLGREVLMTAGKNILKGEIFDENFLMAIASIGAFIIGEYPEAVAVILFYNVGEYFQARAISHSKKSISALMDIRPDSANLKTDTGIKEVRAENVAIGDIIVIKPGEKVPLDGKIVKGFSSIDTKALTGESMPIDMTEGDTILSGSINKNALIEVEVEKPFAESTASKIIDLVENASNKKAKTENFITVFAKYYTPAVCAIALALAVIPPVLGMGAFSDWIYRGLVFLVVSCPCALVISIPLGFFGGIGASSSNGILVKGGNYLEALNKVDTVVFDKTGTLTSGVFKVKKIQGNTGFNDKDVLTYAAYAESNSTHPIAVSIVDMYKEKIDPSIDTAKLSHVEEQAGHGVSAGIDGKNVLAGNKRLMDEKGIEVPNLSSTGTIVYLAVDSVYAGYLIIADEVKEDSKKTISQLKERMVKRIIMLTGDTKNIADNIGEELGITEVKSQLLPGQKVEILEELIDEKERSGIDESKRGKIAFMGDGINDAPVLARADVGIAMGGVGSDAAIEAADIVIMNDEPSKLVKALDIAKKTKRIVWENIGFALGVKGIVLLLAAFGIATMWAAVFADVGVALLATLNSVRAGRV